MRGVWESPQDAAYLILVGEAFGEHVGPYDACLGVNDAQSVFCAYPSFARGVKRNGINAAFGQLLIYAAELCQPASLAVKTEQAAVCAYPLPSVGRSPQAEHMSA